MSSVSQKSQERRSPGISEEQGAHRAEALARVPQRVGPVRQPIRPGFPHPSGPLLLPPPLPCCLVRCMVPEGGRPGVTSPASLAGTGGGGWERLTATSGHPSRGCYRPQRINGAEATHFLWPGDRLNHTAPHCWPPLSQEVPPAPSEEVAGLPTPQAFLFFASRRRESLARLGSCGL